MKANTSVQFGGRLGKNDLTHHAQLLFGLTFSLPLSNCQAPGKSHQQIGQQGNIVKTSPKNNVLVMRSNKKRTLPEFSLHAQSPGEGLILGVYQQWLAKLFRGARGSGSAGRLAVSIAARRRELVPRPPVGAEAGGREREHGVLQHGGLGKLGSPAQTPILTRKRV